MGLETVWTFKAAKNLTAPPALSDDIVAVSGRDRMVRALATADGTERWTRQLRRAGGAALIEAGTVTVGDESGEVHRLDARTGEAVWTSSIGVPVAGQPVQWGETVAVNAGGTRAGEIGGGLFALGVDSGDLLWSVPAEMGARCRPALVKDLLVQVTLDGEILAVNAHGQVVWRRQGFRAAYGAIATSQELEAVIIADAAGGITAVDVVSGDERWRVGAAAGGSFGTPVVNDVQGGVFVTTSDGRVEKRSVGDGSALWSTALGVGEGRSHVCVMVDYLVVASPNDDRIVCFLVDPDGSVVSEVAISGSTPTEPSSLGGLCVVGAAHNGASASVLRLS